jgi:hypothetical protein
MERHSSGAYLPFACEREASSEEMNFETDSPGAYFEAQPQQHISSDHSPYGDQNAYCEFECSSQPAVELQKTILT